MENEWEEFKEQRTIAVEEIATIRRRAAEAEAATAGQGRGDGVDADGSETKNGDDESKNEDMDVDEGPKDEIPKKAQESENKGGAPSTAEDEDDAVEY